MQIDLKDTVFNGSVKLLVSFDYRWRQGRNLELLSMFIFRCQQRLDPVQGCIDRHDVWPGADFKMNVDLNIIINLYRKLKNLFLPNINRLLECIAVLFGMRFLFFEDIEKF